MWNTVYPMMEPLVCSEGARLWRCGKLDKWHYNASPLWTGGNRPVLGGGTDIGLYAVQYVQGHSDFRCTADLNSGVKLNGFSIMLAYIA